MIESRNPYTGELIAEHPSFGPEAIDTALGSAAAAFEKWRRTSLAERSRLMKNLGEVLRRDRQEYARIITQEMGKPISQSLAEIEKCAWLCDYYAENAASHLATEEVETEALTSYVEYDPLGVVLAIMPWNYPFWQVFRFAVPALMAGNVGVLKHASNVMMCGQQLEKLFLRAGFPEACFQNLVISSDQVESVIQDGRVQAITLTGSTRAGSAVAAIAGKEIKKTVLELGGSNALVVLEDADIDNAVKTCVQARFQNTGQSCIAGKRLLLQESVADKFLAQFVAAVKALKSGDPMDPETFIGVQAREDLAKDLEDQVARSLAQGAHLLLGGKRKGAYMEPTILRDVTRDMPVFKEETFGPAIGVTRFQTFEEAVELVNASEFGLGVSVFTSDLEKAKHRVFEFQDGAVFINDLVKSDPRLPFGGTKRSGYGRELSYHGIREFVNIKTVYFKSF